MSLPRIYFGPQNILSIWNFLLFLTILIISRICSKYILVSNSFCQKFSICLKIPDFNKSSKPVVSGTQNRSDAGRVFPDFFRQRTCYPPPPPLGPKPSYPNHPLEPKKKYQDI